MFEVPLLELERRASTPLFFVSHINSLRLNFLISDIFLRRSRTDATAAAAAAGRADSGTRPPCRTILENDAIS